MTKPNALIISEESDAKSLDTKRQSEHWNVFWEIVDYNRLLESDKTQDSIAKHDIDFILYSRNDQVANRISIGSLTKELRVGYSSFSGIDEKNRTRQMKTCLEDFLECNKRLSLEAEKKSEVEELGSTNWTFSLVFDTEQIGGARYGLSRITTLLNKYNIKATFFVTNLLKAVYFNILEEIAQRGHEIGIHGKWHEYLCDLDLEEQRKLIAEMKQDFGRHVYGANFIGRMNQDTIPGLIDNGIGYFVYPQINYYRPFSYPQIPLDPYMIRSTQGNLWMLPISVETYNRPWLSIKNMIDSAILYGKSTNTRHVSILLHPFRDGNLRHIQTTEKLMRYLSTERKLSPITLKEFVDKTSGEGLEHKLVEIHDFKAISELQPLGKLLPKTKYDLLGFLLENSLNVYRLVRRGRTVF